jgi:hypothetical protein
MPRFDAPAEAARERERRSWCQYRIPVVFPNEL